MEARHRIRVLRRSKSVFTNKEGNYRLMKKIGMGLVGPGFVAAHHIDAVRRLGDVDVVAIAGSSQKSAEKKAHEYKVDRAYGNFEDLIADPAISVVHNTTPNHLHFAVS